jgi:hypothetical protein
MADDRQVTCYSLVTEQIAGRDIKAAGIAAWMAQTEDDDGCALLGAVLVDTKQLASPDIWKKIRLSAEANKSASPAGGGAARLVGRDQRRRDLRRPGPLPGEEGVDLRRGSMPSSPPWPSPASPRPTANRSPGCWSTAGRRRCRPTSRPGPGPASPGRRR